MPKQITKQTAIEEGWYSPNQLNGKCYCGCGEAAPLAVQSSKRRKHVSGEPIHFITGHNGKNWKGGSYNIKGYKLIWLPKAHPRRGMASKAGYVTEHRLAMAEHLDRDLTQDEIIHHIDGDKLNNVLSNLELTDRIKHTKYHSEERQEAAELLREIQKRGMTVKEVLDKL